MNTKSNKTRILIVDDHPILRKGIAKLLNEQNDFVVCGETDEARKVVSAIQETKPDAIILDISLKGASGIEVLKDIRTHFPKVKVLILSMHDEAIYAPRALKAGASGYIMKQEAIDNVVVALRKILNNEIYVSESYGAKLLNSLSGKRNTSSSPMDLLSDRELEVFNLLGQGLSTRQIASKLNLSVKTIESHRSHIKEKLNLTTATELIHHAIQWASQ